MIAIASILPVVLPAFVPVISDAIRGIVGKFTNGVGAIPQNVDEEIKLMEARTKNLQVLADLDKPAGNISPWVADLRASFRYIAAGVVILAAISTIFIPVTPEVADLSWGAAQSVWSFIFGDRMYNYIRKGKTA